MIDGCKREEVAIQKEEGMEEDLGKLSRKDKRKAMKKMKRKQARKEIAKKEKEDDEARLHDPQEQVRLQQVEQEEAARRERDIREFEERERAWLHVMELNKKKHQAELEKENQAMEQIKKENELNESDDWEYVEQGPAEIIWQGNEIIVKKKRIKVPKKDVDCQLRKEKADRLTSNPLPPQSEAFIDYKNTSTASAQEMLENVAQQLPNFGTEQDRAHCPFHLKTGACRFGQRCSRAHFYPDKSCTLLIRNMYNGPGLAWEQDEGLEYTDEEIEHCYEEFYEDVHTEFLKYGEIVNFKVCKNGSFHLRGNVYVNYKSLDSAVVAYHSMNGRYFAGKQITCEFVNITKWKVAICGEFMKSRLKTCSHGTACNFIHCFRNPGGDYEWADWDKSPPKYWLKKMTALFGNYDDSEHESQKVQELMGSARNSCEIIVDVDRYVSRSKTRQLGYSNDIYSGSSWDDAKNVPNSSQSRRHSRDSKKRIKIDELVFEDDENVKVIHENKCICHGIYCDSEWSDGVKNHERDKDIDWDEDRDRARKNLKIQDRDRAKHHDHSRKRKNRGKLPILTDDKTHKVDIGGDWMTGETHDHGHTGRSPRLHSDAGFSDDIKDSRNTTHGTYGCQFDRERDRESHHCQKESSRQRRHGPDDEGNTDRAHDTDDPSDRLSKDQSRDGHRNRKKKKGTSSRQQEKNFRILRRE